MPLLKLENLHVALEDGTEIVKGVDLEVDTNEVHAIMGPNGSGKSTLANAIMGNPKYDVSGGQILLKGENILEPGLPESFNVLVNELKALAEDLQAPDTDLLALTLKMPEVMRAERPVVEEPEYNMIKDLFSAALGNFIQFRTDEGRSLRHALIVHIGTISSLLESVAAADLERIPQVRARISKGFKEFKEQVDQNRFEQELIYYIEKLDITEEKVRLKTHLDYFINTLEEPGSGRKLGFIAQEIGREINTIGSKANDAAIQKMVVQMKDELEKVKEQLLNVL